MSADAVLLRVLHAYDDVESAIAAGHHRKAEVLREKWSAMVHVAVEHPGVVRYNGALHSVTGGSQGDGHYRWVVRDGKGLFAIVVQGGAHRHHVVELDGKRVHAPSTELSRLIDTCVERYESAMAAL